MPGTAMTMFTIFWNPLDYPGLYVVREFFIKPGEVVPGVLRTIAKTLEEARAAVPPGLVRILRDPNDEVQIVETWV